MTNPFLQGQPHQQAPQQQQAPAQGGNPFGQAPVGQPPQPAPQGQPAPQQQAPVQQAPQGFPQQQAPQGFQPQQQAPVQQAAPQGGSPFQTTMDASNPFATPTGGGDMESITEEVGQALVIRPTEYVDHVQTKNTRPGEKSDAVIADWIVLTGPNAGKVVNQSMVFNKVLKSELKRIIGTAQPLMVAWLGRGEARNGNSAPYLFGAADEQTRALALQACQMHNWI